MIVNCLDGAHQVTGIFHQISDSLHCLCSIGKKTSIFVFRGAVEIIPTDWGSSSLLNFTDVGKLFDDLADEFTASLVVVPNRKFDYLSKLSFQSPSKSNVMQKRLTCVVAGMLTGYHSS